MNQLMESWRRFLKEQTEDSQALEEFEMAKNVILAFFQNANQGIMLAEYLPNREAANTLTKLFTEIRDDIKFFTQIKKSDFKGKMTDQLRYLERAEAIGGELLNIAHLAGWTSDMPEQEPDKNFNKAIVRFFNDFHESFRKHWFENLPQQKQQEWLDWIGGDL